ncbi:MAG: hypothetical protein LBR43_00660 [Spiroplasmataceae bacterium]|jgi:hypothetical protein|nr:hypothetical protein [Spiroplasmataceae bacterium]
MLIVFDKLLLECIHNSGLHNRCQKNKLRSLLPILLENFSEFNSLTFKEISKQRNCHFVNYHTTKKIIEFFDKHAKKSEVKSFVYYSNLYQIAIPNTEIRLIGDLKTGYLHTKQKSYDDLFSVLFVDFEHSLHPNLHKQKQKDHELICIMKEKDCNY